MATEQALGSLQYNRPRYEATTSQTLASEYRLVETSKENQMVIQQHITLDPDNVAQVTTITITAGSDGDLYDLEVDDGTDSDSYSYRQSGVMAAADIATALAKRLDLHPGLRVTATDDVITAVGVIPGVNIAFDETNSTVAGNLILATTTAAAGTPLTRLISETTINWSSDNSGFPKVSYQTKFYNGAEPAVLASSGALLEGKGNVNLDAIQTLNGIDRPA